MNLRTLKKLSKRAAPLLPLLGDNRDQFRAEADGNYHGGGIYFDRKHWERSHCYAGYQARWSQYLSNRHQEVVFDTRAGRRIVMRPPLCARPGTIMVGASSGGYQPEWDEQCAWSALREHVYYTFMKVVLIDDGKDFKLVPTRRLRTVSEFFQAAGDLIRERQEEEKRRKAGRARRDAERATLREAA